MAKLDIKKAIKKPGSLRNSLHTFAYFCDYLLQIKAAAKKPGKLGQRARFAITLKKLKKK